MKLKKLLVPLQFYIILCISCGISSPITSDSNLVRPKRTLHYFIEGILSAFAEKNRSRSHSAPLSGLTRLSALSINTKKTVSDEETESIPMQYAIPTQQVAMPTKISLPLMRTEKTSTTTMATTTSSTSSTTTSTTSTTTTSTTIGPTTTNRIELDTEVFTEMPTTITNTDIPNSAETIPIDTTDSTVTTIFPCPDEMFSTLPAPIELTSPISNEILSKSDSNETSSLTANARQLPVYQDRPFLRAIGGRHTQFFGNPMILERHQDDQAPIYYDEYDYGNANANDIEPNKLSTLRGLKFLPQPLIILPMAVPIPSSELDRAFVGNEISRSRVKMHDSDTHQYTWHAMGNPTVPIVNLHQAHVQFFTRKE